jgi:hypothetical protein
MLCLLIIGCILISASGCPIRIRSTGTTESPETSEDPIPSETSEIEKPTEDPSEQIARIYVYHSSFGMTESEYRIDLDGRALWIFIPAWDDYDDYAPRDPDAENEGFTLVSELSEEAVETFRDQCEHFKLTRWKDEYYNDDICDGHQWGMTIRFADGSERQIHGSNEYPGTWDDMREAFEELTSQDILQVSSDWLDD